MVPGAELPMMRSGKIDKTFTHHQHKWQIHPCNSSKHELGCWIWGNDSWRWYEHNQQFCFVVKLLKRKNLDPVVYLKREKARAAIQLEFNTSLADCENFAMLSLVSRMKTSKSQLEEDCMQSAVSQKPPSGSKLNILHSVIRWSGRS